jgi:hypothetical protein
MGFLDQKVTDRFAIYNGDSMEIGLNMFNRAGENVVLTVVRTVTTMTTPACRSTRPSSALSARPCSASGRSAASKTSDLT